MKIFKEDFKRILKGKHDDEIAEVIEDLQNSF